MAFHSKTYKHIPGMYPKTRPDAAEMAAKYVREWDQKRLEIAAAKGKGEYWPAICFSRDVAVGALEIAVTLAERIGYRVVDRQILEYAVYGKKDISPHEFDLVVINCDYLGSPGCAADMVERAFREKFPGKLR